MKLHGKAAVTVLGTKYVVLNSHRYYCLVIVINNYTKETDVTMWGRVWASVGRTSPPGGSHVQPWLRTTKQPTLLALCTQRMKVTPYTGLTASTGLEPTPQALPLPSWGLPRKPQSSGAPLGLACHWPELPLGMCLSRGKATVLPGPQ